MKATRVLPSIALAAGVAMLQPVHAASPESGVTIQSGKQTQEPERVQSPGKMTTPPLTPGKRDQAQPRPTPTTPAKIDPYKGESGQMVVLNCSGSTAEISVFNGNDVVRMVPYMKTSVRPNAVSSALNCATTSCQLAVKGWRWTVPSRGPLVLKEGSRGPLEMKYTNTAAMKQGCSIY